MGGRGCSPPGLPARKLLGDPGRREVFCSVGSGHFSQALNLFRVEGRSIWSPERYVVKDPLLRRALDEGIKGSE